MIISPVNHKAEPHKSALLKVWSVLLIVFIASCASHPKANIDAFLSMDQVRNTNRDNLARLSVGMSKSQVLKVMGARTVETELMAIKNPYRVETLKASDGKTYEIVSYYTDIKKTDGTITDDELTPLVFEAGKLIGWGWSFLNQNVSQSLEGM
jgi:hypothetical protein